MQKLKNRKVSNPLGLAVLACLYEQPLHPYQISTTLKERAKEQSIKLNYGSLYTVINALEKAGFIEVQGREQQGQRPERTVYEITGEGLAELQDWMRELLSIPIKEYPRFEAALSLMPTLPPDEVVDLLEERQNHLKAKVQAMRDHLQRVERQGIDRLFTIEVEYELAMMEAERRWVVGLIKIIQDSPGFASKWAALLSRVHNTVQSRLKEKKKDERRKKHGRDQSIK